MNNHYISGPLYDYSSPIKIRARFIGKSAGSKNCWLQHVRFIKNNIYCLHAIPILIKPVDKSYDEIRILESLSDGHVCGYSTMEEFLKHWEFLGYMNGYVVGELELELEFTKVLRDNKLKEILNGLDKSYS